MLREQKYLQNLARSSSFVKMLKLMDVLEQHDDVQDVYSNFYINDDILNNV